MSIRVTSRKDFVSYGATQSLAEELHDLHGRIAATKHGASLNVGDIEHKIVWDKKAKAYVFCQDHFKSYAKRPEGKHAKGRLFPILVGEKHNKVHVITKAKKHKKVRYETRKDVEELCSRIIMACKNLYKNKTASAGHDQKKKEQSFRAEPSFVTPPFPQRKEGPPKPTPQDRFEFVLPSTLSKADREWALAQETRIKVLMRAVVEVGATIDLVLPVRPLPVIISFKKLSPTKTEASVFRVDFSELGLIGFENDAAKLHRLLVRLLDRNGDICNDPEFAALGKTWKIYHTKETDGTIKIHTRHRILADLEREPTLATPILEKGRLARLVSQLTCVESSGLIKATPLYEQILSSVTNDREAASMLQRILRGAVIGETKLEGLLRKQAIRALQLIDAKSLEIGK